MNVNYLPQFSTIPFFLFSSSFSLYLEGEKNTRGGGGVELWFLFLLLKLKWLFRTW